MKLSKKGGGIAAAVVMAGGLAAASTTSAFAAGTTPHTTPVAKGADKDKKDADKGHHKHGRHARFLHGTHGEKTVKGKDGKEVTHEWQVGKVTAATATSLTVKSSDGVSWTWTTSADTKMHSPKHAAPKVGDEVLVEGVKAGSANDARVVIDPDQAELAKWMSHDAKSGADDAQGAAKGDADQGDHHAPLGKHRRNTDPHAPAPHAPTTPGAPSHGG